MNVYEHPANGYREVGGTTFSWLWCLLFGFFYLAIKGAWGHAAVALVLAVITLGWSWLAYPFFAKHIVDTSYLKRDWRLVADGPKPMTVVDSAERLRMRAMHQ